ncbi:MULTISPECIES: hypothetical protein [Rhodococcus]|uniref:hypothetical protein n=1 Tax=Rhodococcus TaxID=1827 RepID=UPI001E5C9AB2|nr:MULTISPECIES: hypothetical protein [Rhodococcus]
MSRALWMFAFVLSAPSLVSTAGIPVFGEWHVIAVERTQAGLHRQRRVGRGRASEFVDQVLRQARAFEKDGGRRGIE